MGNRGKENKRKGGKTEVLLDKKRMEKKGKKRLKGWGDTH